MLICSVNHNTKPSHHAAKVGGMINTWSAPCFAFCAIVPQRSQEGLPLALALVHGFGQWAQALVLDPNRGRGVISQIALAGTLEKPGVKA